MATFWRLKKKDYMSVAFELQKRIPELKAVHSDSIITSLRGSNMDFYETEKTPKSIIVRLTLPVAIVTMIVLFVLLPFNYLLTGKWGYKKLFLINWYRSLGLC